MVVSHDMGEATMQSNICKFPTASYSNDLSVFRFVFETEQCVMGKERVLEYNRMILIEQGEGELLLDAVPYKFSAGTLVFGFEGERFSLSRGDNVRYLYIDFNGARAKDLFYRFEIFPHSRTREGFNGLIPFFKDSLLSAVQENIDIISESVLLHVFSRLSVPDPKQNSTIQKILEITEKSFQDPELSLSVIADMIGYNPKYLSHFFKRKMNISYVEYLRSYRFKYAISLFELGISSVKNVALLSGFADPLYFSSSFKKTIGVSPTEFIKKAKDYVRK